MSRLRLGLLAVALLLADQDVGAANSGCLAPRAAATSPGLVTRRPELGAPPPHHAKPGVRWGPQGLHPRHRVAPGFALSRTETAAVAAKGR